MAGGWWWIIEADDYLSLVVLDVEEGVIVGQFDHLEGMVCGFMNDGQVEKPVWWEERERSVKTVLFRTKYTRRKWFPAKWDRTKARAVERFARMEFCRVISTSCGLTHLMLYQFLAAGQGLSWTRRATLAPPRLRSQPKYTHIHTRVYVCVRRLRARAHTHTHTHTHTQLKASCFRAAFDTHTHFLQLSIHGNA